MFFIILQSSSRFKVFKPVQKSSDFFRMFQNSLDFFRMLWNYSGLFTESLGFFRILQDSSKVLEWFRIVYQTINNLEYCLRTLRNTLKFLENHYKYTDTVRFCHTSFAFVRPLQISSIYFRFVQTCFFRFPQSCF